MSAPVAMILAIAAGREADLLDAQPLTVAAEGELQVEHEGRMCSFLWTRVRRSQGEGQPAVNAFVIPTRPSSGTAQAWHLYVLQPATDTRPAVAKAFKTRLETWLSSRQPVEMDGQDVWHVLGPYTPARFRALTASRPALWAACAESWPCIWRGNEGSAEAIAEQQGYDDADLDEEP